MSSISLDIYAGPKEAETPNKELELLKYIGEKRFDIVQKQHPKFLDGEVKNHFDGRIELHRLQNEVILLTLETRSSFPHREFLKFISNSNNIKIEASVFHDQVGEFEYFKDGAFISNYSESTWNWLGDPEPVDFEEKHIVVTGKFQHYTRNEVEETIEDWGGIVQKSINGKTELLIVGEKPGASKTNKAEKLGIKQISEGDFMHAIGE